MIEKIYTIPITEIFEEECFCPFCTLYKRLEAEEIKYALGPAMMEPDYRAITNEKGFCKDHMAKLNSLPKALPLALVIDTHMKKIQNIFDVTIKEKGFIKKESNKDEYVNNFLKFNDSCAICDRIDHTFMRYIDTFVYMIKENPDFLSKVIEGNGFCLPHYTNILTVARKSLKGKQFEEIFNKLNETQKRKFKKYQKDIGDFIESFDYHHANEPCIAPADTVIKSGHLLNGEFKK